jgi:hypothetical protein
MRLFPGVAIAASLIGLASGAAAQAQGADLGSQDAPAFLNPGNVSALQANRM